MENTHNQEMKHPKPNSTANTSGVKYWFEDMNELVSLDNMNQFLPSREMTYAAKVNALVRLSWYIGLLAGIFTSNYLYLYIPIITMIITYVLYLFRHQELQGELEKRKIETAIQKQKANSPVTELDPKLVEKFQDYLDNNDMASRPSDSNPFMNPLPFDDRKRPPAVPILSNPVNRAEIELSYDKGVWRDANDVWDKNNGKRQFFTMPWTTYPNDQGSFANWLYKTPPTCKEGNGNQCVANVFDIQTSNRVLGGLVSGAF